MYTISRDYRNEIVIEKSRFICTLKKVATEFESIFVTKMLSEMDKTVDHENSLFGKEGQYVDTFKSIVYQQMGRDIANNPRTSFGFADQIYRQMEKFVG